MVYPFKKTNGVTTDLVKDYDFKAHYPDVNMNTPWAEISPYLKQAIRTYVLPYVGKRIYDDLCQKIQDGETLVDEQSEFADRLKDVCANYAVMVMLPKKKTKIASLGAIENVATEGTTASSLWGFKTTLWAVCQDADRMMDELLSYMQEMVEAEDSYFIEYWSTQSAYTSLSSGIFRKLSDFSEFHKVNSLRTFKAIVPFTKQVEEQMLVPIISQEQYDRLIAGLTANDLTASELALLTKCRRMVAKYTVYEASMGLPIIAEQDGFRVISNADAVDQRAYSSEVIVQAIQGMQQQAERAGKTANADLVAFLYTNKADYPLFADSDCCKTEGVNTDVLFAGPGAVFI